MMMLTHMTAQREVKMAATVKTVVLPTRVVLPYFEHGDPAGIPILLLHGFADSWRSFEPVLDHLPTSIHAFALTQRGHGDASKPAAGYHVRDFAADLAAFMDAVPIQAAILAGHSMGSAVALRFAIDHPERTLGLILVGASPSLRANPGARQFWEATISRLTDPVDPDFVRRFVEGMVVKPLPQPLFEAVLQESRKVPAHVWKAAFESRFRSEDDYAEQLGQIKAPTLILWGDQDARYPRSDQEVLAADIPEARLVVYPGAGHLLHLEQPKRFASDLVTFASSLAH